MIILALSHGHSYEKGFDEFPILEPVWSAAHSDVQRIESPPRRIDAVELELRPGLTVLTGETGAGKSILVDALQLLATEVIPAVA